MSLEGRRKESYTVRSKQPVPSTLVVCRSILANSFLYELVFIAAYYHDSVKSHRSGQARTIVASYPGLCMMLGWYIAELHV